MAGPGGGSRGGGGGRGGSFGSGGGRGGMGGGRGGSFGGRPGGYGYGPRGPMFGGPMYGGWGYRRRRYGFYGGPGYYGGGGCLGGLLGLFLLPILLIVFAVIMVFSSLASSFTILSDGGIVPYNEETFQDYANEQYLAEYGSSEDGILLVFLTAENYYDFCYIGWVGNHVSTDVNYLFGGDGSPLGNEIHGAVPDNYKYALSSNLTNVTNRMATRASAVNTGYICQEAQDGLKSHAVNRSALTLDVETINMALASFTEQTGIPMTIVVDEMEDVFGKEIPFSVIFTLILAGGVVVVAIVLIVKTIRKRKKEGPGNPGQGSQGNPGGQNGGWGNPQYG